MNDVLLGYVTLKVTDTDPGTGVRQVLEARMSFDQLKAHRDRICGVIDRLEAAGVTFEPTGVKLGNTDTIGG